MCGAYLVHTQCSSSMCVVPVWLVCGARLTRVWCSSNLRVVLIWPARGVRLANAWCLSGVHMVPVCAHGTHLVSAQPTPILSISSFCLLGFEPPNFQAILTLRLGSP